jgi:hypothetical protein
VRALLLSVIITFGALAQAPIPSPNAGGGGGGGAGSSTTRAVYVALGGQGVALTTSSKSITVPVAFACTTLTGYQLSSGTGDTGTTTVKFAKTAAGAVAPTASDSINTSGVTITAGASVNSSTVTDFTSQSVAKGDQIIIFVTATSGTASAVTGVLLFSGCS